MIWFIWLSGNAGHGPIIELLIGDLVIWAFMFGLGYGLAIIGREAGR